MALTYCKKLHFVVKKNNTISAFADLRNSFQNVLSVAHYSDNTTLSRVVTNRAVQTYLEKVRLYDEFMKEQIKEFNKGKEFLASMMGRKSQEFTQKDIDEAIEYLFPSALFVPKARPLMKPPEELFGKQKSPLFDSTGRPFHFLFYTSKQSYTMCLHDAASKLEELNKLLTKKTPPPKPLLLVGGRWMNQKELERLFLEKLFEFEYNNFLEVMRAISSHPMASMVEDFIRKFWVKEEVAYDMEIPESITLEDGTEVVNVTG